MQRSYSVSMFKAAAYAAAFLVCVLTLQTTASQIHAQPTAPKEVLHAHQDDDSSNHEHDRCLTHQHIYAHTHGVIDGEAPDVYKHPDTEIHMNAAQWKTRSAPDRLSRELKRLDTHECFHGHNINGGNYHEGHEGCQHRHRHYYSHSGANIRSHPEDSATAHRGYTHRWWHNNNALDSIRTIECTDIEAEQHPHVGYESHHGCSRHVHSYTHKGLKSKVHPLSRWPHRWDITSGQKRHPSCEHSHKRSFDHDGCLSHPHSFTHEGIPGISHTYDVNNYHTVVRLHVCMHIHTVDMPHDGCVTHPHRYPHMGKVDAVHRPHSVTDAHTPTSNPLLRSYNNRIHRCEHEHSDGHHHGECSSHIHSYTHSGHNIHRGTYDHAPPDSVASLHREADNPNYCPHPHTVEHDHNRECKSHPHTYTHSGDPAISKHPDLDPHLASVTSSDHECEQPIQNSPHEYLHLT